MGYIVYDKKNSGIINKDTRFNDLLSGRFRMYSHLLGLCNYSWREDLSNNNNIMEVKSEIVTSNSEIPLEKTFNNIFRRQLLTEISKKIFEYINDNISKPKRHIRLNNVSKNLLDIILDNFGDLVSDENISVIVHSKFLRDLEDIRWFRPYVGYGNIIGHMVNMPVMVSDSVVDNKTGTPMILVGEKNKVNVNFQKDIRFYTQHPYNGSKYQLSSSVILECELNEGNFLTLRR